MRAKLSAGVLVVCVVAALWVGAPEGTLSYLLRSPLVLIRDTIASIIDHLLGSDEPSPATATSSSPFIDPEGATSTAEEAVPAKPAITVTTATKPAVQPALTATPLQAAEQLLPLPPSWDVVATTQASDEPPATEETPATEESLTTEEPPNPLIQLPGVEVPGVEVPGVEVPGVEVPGVEVPGVEGPGVEVPGVEVPGIEVPGSEVPDPGDVLPDLPGL